MHFVTSATLASTALLVGQTLAACGPGPLNGDVNHWTVAGTRATSHQRCLVQHALGKRKVKEKKKNRERERNDKGCL